MGRSGLLRCELGTGSCFGWRLVFSCQCAFPFPPNSQISAVKSSQDLTPD